MPRQPTETHFGAADYVVFGVMLLLSLGIGVFYAIKDKRSEAVNVYLLGGRKMHFFPVGMSLSLSFVSAVTILGIPAEVYLFGSMYYWFVLVLFVVTPVCTEMYIPMFYRLQITSSFEYLQLRFNNVVRLLGTAAYIAQNIMYMGVMIYAPATALSAVSNFNLWAAIFTIGIVCTLYTALGGLKAVIWSDVFQGFVVIVVMFVAMFVSASHAGGWQSVWEKNWNGNRIDFVNFDFDPRFRHSFWSVVVGFSILWCSMFGTSQSQVQRYLCCTTETDAKKGLVLSMFVALVIVTLCLIIGWTMYAFFYDCDPIRNKEVTKPDQLLPYLIMIVFRSNPGLPGLFVAGVFAGSLSTVSSGINAMACVTIQDFIRPFVKWREGTLTHCSKALVVLYGLLSIGFACISTLLGNALQTSLSVLNIIAGPLLGIFTLGMLFPCADMYGAIVGLVFGIAFSSWIYIGSQRHPLPFTSPFYRLKPSTLSGCIPRNNTEFTSTTIGQSFNESYSGSGSNEYTTVFQTTPIPFSMDDITTVAAGPSPGIIDSPSPGIIDMYSVSYAYIGAIGFAVTLLLGLLVSLITSHMLKTACTDPTLIYPFFDHKLFRFLPKSFRKMMWCGVPRDERAKRQKERENMADMKFTIEPMSAASNVDVIRGGEENKAYTNTEEASTRI